jgi:hypothetical protein
LYKLYKIIEFEGHFLTNINNIYLTTIDDMAIYKNNSEIINKTMFETENINLLELSSDKQEEFILTKLDEIFKNYLSFNFNYFFKENNTNNNYISPSIIKNPYKNIYFIQKNSLFSLLVLIFLTDNLNLLNYFKFIIKNNKLFKLPDTLVILSLPNYQLISNYNNNNYNFPIPLTTDENCNLYKEAEKNAYLYLKEYIKKFIYIEDVSIYDMNTLSKSLAAQLII